MLPYIDIFNLKIPSYGLLLCVALVLASVMCLLRTRKTALMWENVLVVIASSFGAGILGGSLLYLFVTYSLSEIWNFITTFNFKVLFSGGLVFYGGLIGGIIGGITSVKLLKLDLAELEPCAVPALPLAHAVGRIGCLLAGCCWGCVYNGPLAVSYPHAITGVSNSLTYFPVQALESFLDIVIMIILLFLARKPCRKLDLLSVYVTLYAIMRFITELFRGDAIRGTFGAFSTSQWISTGLLTIVVIRFIVLKIRDKKKQC